MLAGEITPAQALAAAGDKDAATRQRRICQANFYAGEVALSEGNREEAARLFRRAADDCPATYIERQSAATELRALDQHP
jgi:lipoprotein NlpI